MEVQYLRNQQDEFTALTNIYLDEFQVVKQTAPYKFNILCKPYKGNQLEYQINIMFEFTKKYPATPLRYEIEPIAGLTRDNINHIIKIIDELVQNSQQKPVVFDIIEETRNWIHQYLVEGRTYQTEETQADKVEEMFERPKFAAFTPVTIQNFNAWKKEFDAKHRAEKQKNKKETEVKISGKEWFLGKNEPEVEDEQDEDDQQEEIEDQGEIKVQQPENELFRN